MALTPPSEAPVVKAVQIAVEGAPKRTSLPSMLTERAGVHGVHGRRGLGLGPVDDRRRGDDEERHHRDQRPRVLALASATMPKANTQA